MGAKSKLQLRDAHGKGQASILWDKAGKHLITGGVDGRVLIHTWDPSVPAAVLTTLKPHNVAVTCVALSPNGTVLASGSVDHSVKLYSYPGGTYQSTVTRFTLPIRSLAFSVTGGLLAAAGDDDGIKLISMADNSIARILKGHGAPVVGLAFDPKNEYIASVDSDGTVMFWLISSGRNLHTLHHIAPRIDVDSESRNTAAWHPDGNLLAVPGSRNDVLLLDRDTAEEMCTLKGGHTNPVSTLAWSLNGKYLATSGCDHQVVLWDVEKQQDIDGMLFDTSVCFMTWKPVENALALINMDGKFSVWESAVPSHMVSPTICVKSSHVSATNFEELHKFSDDEGSEGHGQSIDLGSEDTAGGDGDGDGDGDNGESDEEFWSSKKKRERNSLSVDAVYDKKAGKSLPEKGTRGATYTLQLPAMQGSFQPGSTDKVEGKRWFLAYNLIGSISSCEKDGSCHVEVEFHDISRGMRIPTMADYFGFTMSALGEKACILASPQNGDKNPSTLMYRPFNSWGTNSEWSIRFPADEEVKAVAVGDGWGAAVTSLHLLRIFSGGGLQRSIFSLSGPVVAMAGHQQLLVVASHASSPLSSGDQAVEFIVLDLQRQIKTVAGRLPLSPGANLSWIGFSESGSLGSYDTQGVLRRHCHEFGGCWVPIFRSEKEKKSSSECFWMVGFNDTQVFAVICKLPETQPLVFPRPVLSFFSLSLPLLHSDLGGDDLENVYLRHSLLLSQARVKADQAAAEGLDVEQEDEKILEMEAEHDKYVLRLIAAACKGNKLVKAMELATSLQLHKSLEGAIKLVNALRLPALAERLNLVLEKRMLEKNSQDDVQEIPYVHHPVTYAVRTPAVMERNPSSDPAITQHSLKEVTALPTTKDDTNGAISRQKDAENQTKEGISRQKPMRFEKEARDTLDSSHSDKSDPPKPDQPISVVRKVSNPFAKSATSTQNGAAAAAKSNVPLLDSLKLLQTGKKRKEKDDPAEQRPCKGVKQ